MNRRLRELYPDSEDVFDIVLMTNNHAQVGVRLINSINHYGEHEHEDGGFALGHPYQTPRDGATPLQDGVVLTGAPSPVCAGKFAV